MGTEFHNGYPAPQRISFFYPIANSIDRSNEYWTRDTSLIMDIHLKEGNGAWENLSRQAAPFSLTPYRVTFTQIRDRNRLDLSYRYCLDSPAMVLTMTLTNTGTSSETYRLGTRLSTSLRTCHTFRKIEEGWTSVQHGNAALITEYPDSELAGIAVFVLNAGEQPVSFDSRASITRDQLASFTYPQDSPGPTAASYRYQKQLAPGETMQIIQVIGSCYTGETDSLIAYLADNYRDEIEAFENTILNTAQSGFTFNTGDPVLDHSARWAKSVLAVTDHYLDGDIVPMPCPAEYNFYFTHDALVTDLAAVNFDLPRVKRDLEYLLKHATEDYIIPHAYYWKDGGYRTEYADSNNWNHFWFIQTAASYLRHSGDEELLQRCYPYLTKSLRYALHSREPDGLLYAYYLDGWDIGHNFGPRAFMTIMAIKGISDYIFISTYLEENVDQLNDLAGLAKEMETALDEKLWNDELGFLINYYENGAVDPHYYAGSLLAAHFRLLDQDKRSRLIQTASEKLVDPAIGAFTVYPPDFHLLGDFLKFKGDEAGPPHIYANGAVWNHCSAWYALGLMVNDKWEDAYDFIRRIMTIDGIINSPNGQPAMYEYRNSNKSDPDVYGRIDKPQFLWAAGWYLYSLYHLYGLNENVWNISFDPFLQSGTEFCEFDVALHGRRYSVSITGEGDYLKSIRSGSRVYHSAVFSPSVMNKDKIRFIRGRPEQPYLAAAEAIVQQCSFHRKRQELQISLRAYPGHIGSVTIVSPLPPTEVLVNGEPFSDRCETSITMDGICLIDLDVPHHYAEADVSIHFSEPVHE